MSFAKDSASDNEALNYNSGESDVKDKMTCPRT